ncbi:MAG: aldehyde dehydrogenase family protein [Parasphingorhabdus sp.]
MTAVIADQLNYPDSVTQALSRQPALFIDGQWVASSHSKTAAVYDPATGKEISQFVDASDEDVNRAVAAARIAFDDGRWCALAPATRQRFMLKLADLIDDNADELAALEAIDNGKPLSIARNFDIPRCSEILRYMAGWIAKIPGDSLDPLSAPAGDFHAYVRREPIGVTGLIVPWNLPLFMAVMKIAPALAAGCTVILKPAEQTSLSALRLADLVQQSGIPDGVVNIMTGLGETAGDRLVRHPDVDKIAFTGSTQTGKMINIAATDSLKRVTLELGGKAPLIVMPDADIEAAVAGSAGSIFFNSGQICIAGSRLFAHKSVFDKMIEGVSAQADQWTMGPSLAANSRMGPLVSDEQRTRVAGYIESGKKQGGTIVAGGDVLETDGYYVEPTVIVDVKPGMSVVDEEIFGPVLVAQRFEDMDDVIKAANATPFGLSASVWTRDLTAMHKLAAAIKAGTIWGNCNAKVDPALPFGGYKQSGVGREQGADGIRAYMETKTVMIAL